MEPCRQACHADSKVEKDNFDFFIFGKRLAVKG
jgi:hypothetical protein